LSPKHLLFDLDGTLTDPREGITRCVQFALARQDIRVLDLADLECFIGPPLKESFMHFHGLDEAGASQAVADYRERFSDVGMYENRVYQGMPELLDLLRRDGRRLFVVTSKPWFYARPITEHFGLAPYFETVHGSEMDGTRTDKRDLIAHVLHQEHIPPTDALMIGDRRYDIIGARHNGVASVAVGYGYGSHAELVAVGYGYGSHAELQAANPSYGCDSVAALRRLLAA